MRERVAPARPPLFSQVWFHSVRAAVARAAHTRGVRWVDLGPSAGDRFEDLKARYGFEISLDWAEVCGYHAAPFATPAPLDALPPCGEVLSAKGARTSAAIEKS